MWGRATEKINWEDMRDKVIRICAFVFGCGQGKGELYKIIRL